MNWKTDKQINRKTEKTDKQTNRKTDKKQNKFWKVIPFSFRVGYLKCLYPFQFTIHNITEFVGCQIMVFLCFISQFKLVRLEGLRDQQLGLD